MTDSWWWRADALCAQVGPDLFFLRRGESGNEAKRVCAMCPVRAECLADALIANDEYGIFGGLGRDERRDLTQQVREGADPLAAATAAIEKEKHHEHRVPRLADHRPRRWRSGHGDRLHADSA